MDRPQIENQNVLGRIATRLASEPAHPNVSEGADRRSLGPNFAAALLLLAVFLAANSRVFRANSAPIWDAFDYFAPYYSLIADHARAGRVLLWNPWVSAGSPDFAEPELGAFSPVQVLVGAAAGGTKTGFFIYWLLIWYFGAAGMIPLARHLQAPVWGAFVVALGYGFSGFFIGHAEHTSSLYSIAFLPWIVWRLDVALTSGRWFPAVQAGALWGLSALGGYPQLTILSGGFLALWALGCWCCAEHPEEGRLKPNPAFVLTALLLVLCVGLLVLAPSYVGFFSEAFGYSDRTGPRLREVAIVSNALHPGALASFASPYVPILKLFNPGLWKSTDVSMASTYMGALIPVLAMLALLVRPRSHWRWWLAVLALLFIACSLGKHLPLRGWLYDLLPPTRFFRNASMFSAYSIFAFSVLALLASSDLRAAIKHGTGPIWRLLFAVAAVVAMAAIAALVATIHVVADRGTDVVRATVAAVIIWFAPVALAAGTWVSWRPRRLLPLLLALVAIGDALFVVALAGRLTVTRSEFPSLVSARLDAEHVTSLDLTGNGLRRDLRPPAWLNQPLNPGGNSPAKPPFAPSVRNLPLKIATLDNYETLTNRFYDDSVYQPVLMAMATGERRIWFSPDAPRVAPADAVYRAVLERSNALGRPVLVVHARQDMMHLTPVGRPGPRDAQDAAAIMHLPPAQQLATQVLHYSPNRLALNVTCPEDGWLLVTDRWSPGWKAEVNGRPADVLGGNFVYRAVRVEAGPNQVRLRYRPLGWPLLLIVSWGTLAVVLVLSIFTVTRARTLHKSGRNHCRGTHGG